jgi:hypothetical protein
MLSLCSLGPADHRAGVHCRPGVAAGLGVKRLGGLGEQTVASGLRNL